ncbi:hypothetical protein [Spirosoma telluris]
MLPYFELADALPADIAGLKVEELDLVDFFGYTPTVLPLPGEHG